FSGKSLLVPANAINPSCQTLETKVMRKLAIAVSVVLSLTGAHAVLADQHKAGGGPVKGEISQAVETQATVMAIDQKKRMVTLKSPEGNESTFQVDKRVRNLPQVK